MKTITTCLMLLCGIFMSLPALSRAAAPDAAEKASLSALNQPLLLNQSAGEVALIVEPGRRGRWHGGYAYGISAGAVILTAVIVTLIVLGSRPGDQRY